MSAADGDRWHREGWHRLSMAERRELQRERHEEQFVVKEYRCRWCVVVVDGSSRRGHLGRCRGMRGRELEAADLAGHFTEVAKKGEGWRVDAAVPAGVKQAAGGHMDSGTSEQGNGAAVVSPADKRAWAAEWARGQASPTAVGLIAAVKARFGTGVSNRVASAILKGVRKAGGETRTRSTPPTDVRPPKEVVERVYSGAPYHGDGATPAVSVVGQVLDMLDSLRALGVESFKLGGREYAVR